MEIICHLDKLLKEKNMTVTELSNQVGVTKENLSVLKNNHAKAVRFTTLLAICVTLDCQVGDLLTIST